MISASESAAKTLLGAVMVRSRSDQRSNRWDEQDDGKDPKGDVVQEKGGK